MVVLLAVMLVTSTFLGCAGKSEAMKAIYELEAFLNRVEEQADSGEEATMEEATMEEEMAMLGELMEITAKIETFELTEDEIERYQVLQSKIARE